MSRCDGTSRSVVDRTVKFCSSSRLAIAFIVCCSYLNCVAGNVPNEVLQFNPNLIDLGENSAMQWKFLDLNKSDNGPMAGNNSYGINAGDFDSDGDNDIVVVFQKGGAKVPGKEANFGMVYWLENISGKTDNDMKFSIKLLDDKQVAPKDAVYLGGISKDKMAIVVPAYKSGKTIVYQCDNTKEWEKVTLDSKSLKGMVRAVAADIDNDGSIDFAVASIDEKGQHLSWYRLVGTSTSVWQEIPIDIELPQLVGVDAGDVDKDGDIDLVCASEQSAWPHLLINLDGKGKRWKKIEMHVQSEKQMLEWVKSFSDKPIGQNHVKFADVDGDGDLDCIETGLKNGYVAWRENVNGLEWKFHKVAGKMGSVYAFDVGDIDRDGKIDIAASSAGGGGVYIFYNTDKGLKWKVTRLGDRAGLNWPNITRMADVNKDGMLDILSTDWGNNAVLWLNSLKLSK